MSVQSINRQPAGTPTGGRFAPTSVGESAASLVVADDTDRWAQDRVRELDSQLQDAGWESHRVEAEDDSVTVHLPDNSQYRITAMNRDGSDEYVVEHNFMVNDPETGPYGETVEVGTSRTASGAIDLLTEDPHDDGPQPARVKNTQAWDPAYDKPPF